MSIRFARAAGRFFVVGLMLLPIAAPSARGDELDAMMQQVEKESATGKASGDRVKELMAGIVAGPADERRPLIWECRIYVDNPALIKLVGEMVLKEKPDAASMAALTLGHMKTKDAVRHLVGGLESKSQYVRESAAYGLGIAGDPSALDALQKAMPEKPGLSRWIFEDAVAAIRAGGAKASGGEAHPASAAPAARPASLDGATLFYIGGPSADNLRDRWAEVFERRKFNIRTIGATDLNPQMGAFGGPINPSAFFAALDDKDGKPQVDVVFVSSMMPDEFPFELQWRLMQFARRGGTVVSLGQSFFLDGRLVTEGGKLVRTYRYIPDVWHTCLPKVDGRFRPFLAGAKNPAIMQSGVKNVGHGRVIALQSNEGGHTGGALRGWEEHAVSVPQFEHILDYAIRGDDAFPALADITSVPSRFDAGKTINVTLTCYAGAPAPGEARVDLVREGKVLATASKPVEVGADKSARVTLALTTPWHIADGPATLRAAYAVGKASHAADATLDAVSPLRLEWTFADAYDSPTPIPGGSGSPDAPGSPDGLRGQARIDSRLETVVQNATLALTVFTPDGKTLQRRAVPMNIKPGKNEPVTLRLEPRDYPAGSYPMTLAIESDGRVAQSSQRMLFRNTRWNFDQDLVLAPFGGLDPTVDDRSRKLMVESGFNAVSLQRGATPGWYNWGHGIAPVPALKAMWPGDQAEELGRGWFGETGDNFRHRNPGWNIVNHWDESDTNTVDTERGNNSPNASVFYRHWIQLKYRTLDRLNEAWRGKYVAREIGGRAIPKVGPWKSDFTSWNQVWAFRGPADEWSSFESSMWWQMQNAGREEFHRFNRFHDLWHWTDVAHTRISPSEPPGTLAWQLHGGHRQWGDRPASVMYHVHDGRKGEPIYRRFPWNALAGGARHFSLWLPSLAQTGAFGWNPSWTIWNSDYTMKDWWKPAAAEFHRIREKQQIFLDAWNAHHPAVALLYVNANEPPRALFDALHFAGIDPDALGPGSLRSERYDLAPLKVIIRVGKGDLPAHWKKRIDDWAAAGGTLLDAADFPYPDYGPRKVTADVGVEYWLGSDQTRLLTAKFATYQASLLGALAKAGVVPPAQTLDDQGAPAPHVEPIVLETHDQSQRYLMAIADADIFGSQAAGAAGAATPPGDVVLDAKQGLAEGVKFAGRPGHARAWLLVTGDAPIEARVTVDGKPPVPMRTLDAIDWFRLERGKGERWVAGPAVGIAETERVLKVESNPAGAVKRVVLTSDSVLRPTLRVNDPAVKAVYDVYADQLLPREGEGYRLVMPRSQGQVYALLTEEPGPLKIEAKLLQAEGDRVLRVRLEATRADGKPSDCRHSVLVSARAADGRPVAALAYGIYGDLPGNAAARGASLRGSRTLDLFPSHGDPPLPWTVTVKDFTTGRAAQATVAAAVRFDDARKEPAFASPGEPPAPVTLDTDDLTLTLEADINLVPLRAHLANNTARPLTGQLKIEMPAELLLDGQNEKRVELAPGEKRTVVFPAFLGRWQARTRSMMDSPPRVWFTPSEGAKVQAVASCLWVRGWERRPPLVTDIKSDAVEITIGNFLESAFELKLDAKTPAAWRVTRPLPPSIAVPAGSMARPAMASATIEATLDPDAAQQPELVNVKLTGTLAGKSYDLGGKLAQTEKRRTWYVSNKLPLDGLDRSASQFKMPDKAVDARRDKLWSLEWKAIESDSLIDPPCEIGKPAFAVTRVRFPRETTLAVRTSTDEKIQVWLAGRQMALPGQAAEKNKAPAKSADEFDKLDEQLGALASDATIKVPANTWLPLVVRYERQSPIPLTDLIFVDESGKPVWDATFRAAASE